MSFCRRGELTPGAPPGGGPKPSFLRELASIDPALFPHWSEERGRWQIYRILGRGAATSEDDLVHEYEANDPEGNYVELGSWVIDDLKSRDMRRGQNLDRTEALKALYREMDEREAQKAREEEKRMTDMNREMAMDLRMGAVGRDSIVVPEGVPVGQ